MFLKKLAIYTALVDIILSMEYGFRNLDELLHTIAYVRTPEGWVTLRPQHARDIDTAMERLRESGAFKKGKKGCVEHCRCHECAALL